jgi:hypothetical protein
MKIAESRFQILSRYTMMKDCIKLFLFEKEKLRAMYLTTSARVCFTIDMWTSVQNLIDSDLNLNKRILNFSLVYNHKWETTGKKVESCMLERGISSIFTITVDNASFNDTANEY